MRSRKVNHSIETWKHVGQSAESSPLKMMDFRQIAQSTSRSKQGKDHGVKMKILKSHRESNNFLLSSADSAEMSELYKSQKRSTERSSRSNRFSLKQLGLSTLDEKDLDKGFKPRLSDRYKSKRTIQGNESAPANHDWLVTPMFRQSVRGQTLSESMKGTHIY